VGVTTERTVATAKQVDKVGGVNQKKEKKSAWSNWPSPSARVFEGVNIKGEKKA